MARIDCNISRCKLIELFHKGLEYYYKKDWDNAIKYFEKSKKYEVISNNKDINPSIVFLNRINNYKDEKFPSNWDGIFSLDVK